MHPLPSAALPETQAVHIPAGPAQLEGLLALPAAPRGVVLFAHGSGSSRFSPRNQQVARFFNDLGLGTLLLDLLTEDEQDIDEATREFRFDIPLLARRLVTVVDWLHGDERLQELVVGLFGASTGAAAALTAAATLGSAVGAVVSRGGRPDLTEPAALARVRCPSLLLVGGHDEAVLELNRQAARQMRAPVSLCVVPGASHLFEEAGTLDVVAQAAADWFVQHLPPAAG